MRRSRRYVVLATTATLVLTSAAFATAAPDKDGFQASPTPYKDADFSRITGRLVSSFNSGTGLCSASVVKSTSRSVVVAAAHCVYHKDTKETAYESYFVPASEGRELIMGQPYGAWKAAHIYVDDSYKAHSATHNDFSLIRLEPHGSPDAIDPVINKPVEDVVGAFAPQELKGDHMMRLVGYPVGDTENYTDGTQVYCDGDWAYDTTADPKGSFLTPDCIAHSGNSGGPLLKGSEKDGWVFAGVGANIDSVSGKTVTKVAPVNDIFKNLFARADRP
ncbi:trypsin-like serine peptidase [Streptomyces sp. NPDC012623]|uniref:trypsin-like serine peptidase n=1 Tax=unclassified Streptomyces TaxID=2593676 RepID=UPI00368C69A6